jgi:hypothetical protein
MRHPVSRRITARTAASTAIGAVVCAAALAGCGGGHPPSLVDPPASSPAVTTPADPAGQLAGLAAAAHDRRYVAAYTLARPGAATRSVVADLATDGTWSVNVAGGALGGGGNVTIVGLKNGTYQCLLSGPATTAATPTPTVPTAMPSAATSAPAGASASASGTASRKASGSPSASTLPSPSPSPTPRKYAAPVCVQVAAAGTTLPARYDPVFEHIFTDWLAVMLDREAPISVFAASPLPHSTGACYSVESNSASLAPAMDSGIFCFAPDGTVTAAKIDTGTLTIVGPAVPAPPTTALPAPLVTGPAAPVRAPSPQP